MVFLWGIALWAFLIPDPAQIGIVIHEYSEQEALIRAASEPEVLKSLHDNPELNMETEK